MESWDLSDLLRSSLLQIGRQGGNLMNDDLAGVATGRV
jgi:hypothetical protein